MNLFIILLLTIAATFVPARYYDKELEPYVKDYLTLVQHFCKYEQLHMPPKTQAFFVQKLDKGIIGQCGASASYWFIHVSQPEWVKLKPNQKVELIYHELSHCIIEKDHVDNSQHYMYNSQSDIPIDIIRDQVLEDAWQFCGKK